MSESDQTVQKDCWVSLRYRLFDAGGQPLEEGARELTYLHGGFGYLFPKLEAAIEGRHAGELVSLYLEPEDAFGDYDAQQVELAPRDLFPETLEAGMSFEGLTGLPDAQRIYTVTDIAGDTVVLDGNHPLAGLGIRFDLELLDVQVATDDELESERSKTAE